MNKNTEKKPYTLWLLMLTFAIPIIAAYLYFFLVENPTTKNNGELIVPVIDIEKLSLTDKSGTKLSRKELTATWRMMYFVNNDCDKVCVQELYHMRQINVALGKNADRFKYMIVHLGTMSSTFTELVRKEHPNALHAYANIHNVKSIFAKNSPELFSDAIFIMDPIGNIMMKFSPEISPNLILKDLNLLLKVSRIG